MKLESKRSFRLFSVLLVFLIIILISMTASAQTVINDSQVGPIPLSSGESLTVTPTGEITLTNGVMTEAAIIGLGINMSVTNNGLVEAINGNNAPAILLDGINMTVINGPSGTIEATGSNSAGISIRNGINAYVENHGTITPGLTDNNEAISVVGTNCTIINTSPISTTGSNSEGISLVGDNCTVTNTGAFTSTGTNSEAMSISGLNIDVTSSGAIATNAFQSEGISLSGDYLTLIRSDPIQTVGNESEGISSQGFENELDVGSDITTMGDNSEGISVSATFLTFLGDAVLDFTGSIITEGSDSEGISSEGRNAELNIHGPITVMGSDSEGISVTGRNTSLTISDDIITNGFLSEGVSFIGTNGTILLSGSVSTVDTLSPGIFYLGSGAYIENTGRITTVASDSPAVEIDGSDNVIFSFNEVDAANSSGFLFGDESDSSKDLLVIGDLDAPTDPILNSGTGEAAKMGGGVDTVILESGPGLVLNGVLDGGSGTSDTLVLKLVGIDPNTINHVNFENVIVCTFPFDSPANPHICKDIFTNIQEVNQGYDFLLLNNMNSIKISNVTPNGNVALVWGFSKGNLTIKGNVCNGTDLRIKPAQLLTMFKANANGKVDSIFYVPFVGGVNTAYIQAVDVTSCISGNVMEVILTSD